MDSYDVLSLICPMTSGSATHFLITGDVSADEEGRLTVRCRIFDILNQKELSAFSPLQQIHDTGLF